MPDDDTDDDSGGGPGVAPGLGDQPGGLRLMAPRPPYEGLADEIFDMCDDADAFAVLFARRLGPGEEITDEQRDEISLDRVIDQVSCDGPGGRRYVYMSDVGPSGPFPTAQAAAKTSSTRAAVENRRAKQRTREPFQISPSRFHRPRGTGPSFTSGYTTTCVVVESAGLRGTAEG